jgi:3-deoxy-D-manno-octulosonate 8-phosphate phosphatase (KDO 8-P phosphatase)
MISSEKTDKISAVILDIDGVLTDGRMGYSEADEIKFFHVRDGHGIKLAMRAGLKVGALSGRSAAANRKRATELGFDFLYEGKKDKKAAFAELLKEHNLTAAECLYIGDDVVDAVPMQLAGIGVTVADAPEYMDEFCDMRTTLPGGHGAVREIIDWLLHQQNKWEQLMERYRI